jgi:ABC-type Zn uptake system ZnuABC Zn-binding protein ZnuA
MKKLIALVMVCGFALAFVACGGASKEEGSTESTDTAAMTTPMEADTADSVAQDSVQ